MSEEGHIHVSTHAVGFRHLSSLLAGADVACAGAMKVDRGIIRYLSNKSGHYRPDVFNLALVLRELQAGAIPMDFVVEKLMPDRTSVQYDSVDEFMNGSGFDDASFEAIPNAQNRVRNSAPIEQLTDGDLFEPVRSYSEECTANISSITYPYL